MIKKFSHVAIAVNDINDTIDLFKSLFSLEPSKFETVLDMGVKSAILPVTGGGSIELVEPIDSKSGVGKFLLTKGEGLHHICFAVDDIDSELARLENKGAQVIDRKGRIGITAKVGYIHPKSVKGALVELSENL